ncbi:MAG: NAD(P)/FAD-dependent oxidoreductase [Nitrososphaera sp.]
MLISRLKNRFLAVTHMDAVDVVVVGGSISGLLAAREIAAAGCSVIVLEEDPEIGTPEHCGGLVSIKGIEQLGIVPDYRAFENDRISRARVSSPSSHFEIDARNQKVVVLDRRALDKQAAMQAQQQGAQIRVRCRMLSCSDAAGTSRRYEIKTSEGIMQADFIVDAAGVSSIIKRQRTGVLQSAQYEVYAPWITPETIEVDFDQDKFPGFFGWVIPTSDGAAKIGVAGQGINSASALESYIDSKGKSAVVRKVYAPIWVGGPIREFVEGRTVKIGDAAGQSKPTTAGGIYTCGMGGIIAGRSIAKAIMTGDEKALEEYQAGWERTFKSEFDRMLLARRLLQRLDNKALDEIISAVPADKIQQASESGDFDFHSSAITKILSTKSALKFASALLGNELRRFFDKADKQELNSDSGV